MPAAFVKEHIDLFCIHIINMHFVYNTFFLILADTLVAIMYKQVVYYLLYISGEEWCCGKFSPMNTATCEDNKGQLMWSVAILDSFCNLGSPCPKGMSECPTEKPPASSACKPAVNGTNKCEYGQ